MLDFLSSIQKIFNFPAVEIVEEYYPINSIKYLSVFDKKIQHPLVNQNFPFIRPITK